MDFSFDSIAIVPNLDARVLFHSDNAAVLKEDEVISLYQRVGLSLTLRLT